MLVLEGQRKAAMGSMSASEKLDSKSNAVGKEKATMSYIASLQPSQSNYKINRLTLIHLQLLFFFFFP